MPNLLNNLQANALNQDCRQFYQQYSGGLAALLNSLDAEFSAGEIGIGSNAWDVDSLCLGGGAFSLDADTTTGLTFGYYGGRVSYGQSVLTIAAGTIALSASTTNYVEVNPLGGGGAGTVTTNTTGFTAGRLPLYTIVTGSSAITSVTVAKVLLDSPPSSAALTTTVQIALGSITGSFSQSISAPNFPATLTGIGIVNTNTIGANNTNYWSFSLTNKQAGFGSVNMLGAGNTTQVTGGSGILVYAVLPFTLSSTGANLVTAAADGLLFSAVPTGSPTNLTGTSLRLDFAIPG